MDFNIWFLSLIGVIALFFIMLEIRDILRNKKPETSVLLHKIGFLGIVLSLLIVSYDIYKTWFTILTIAFLILYVATWKTDR
ncbi:hypothetical protein LCM20_16135 [Halobacillus litoralis]|uniref:hypothetical protein n=1 Tax=Halobacillus litoralis TaxID=45668 RepID=UPI001CD670AF|nr:hypothetical protein [Halobacillus litoralis]MCA0972137.1 hypothetical protein [Halobacillus litoralis]